MGCKLDCDLAFRKRFEFHRLEEQYCNGLVCEIRGRKKEKHGTLLSLDEFIFGIVQQYQQEGGNDLALGCQLYISENVIVKF